MFVPSLRQNRASKRDIVNYVEREAEVLTKKLVKPERGVGLYF